MTKFIRAWLLALPLLVVPSSAHAWCCFPPVDVDAGAHFKMTVGGHQYGFGMAQAGPWYSYWPYEAHFMTPAPYAAYPYWPSAAVTGNGNGVPATPTPAPLPPAKGDATPAGYQPVGYSQAPSYWYGR